MTDNQDNSQPPDGAAGTRRPRRLGRHDVRMRAWLPLIGNATASRRRRSATPRRWWAWSVARDASAMPRIKDLTGVTLTRPSHSSSDLIEDGDRRGQRNRRHRAENGRVSAIVDDSRFRHRTRFPGDMNTRRDVQALLDAASHHRSAGGSVEEFPTSRGSRAGRGPHRGGYLSDIKGFDASSSRVEDGGDKSIHSSGWARIDLGGTEHAHIPAVEPARRSGRGVFGSSNADYQNLPSDPAYHRTRSPATPVRYRQPGVLLLRLPASVGDVDTRLEFACRRPPGVKA